MAKSKKDISLWAIIFIVILAVYALSFVIPSGEFARQGKYAVPGTYKIVEKVFLSPIEVFMAVGDVAYSSFGRLFVTLLIIGGMVGVVNSTKVIDTLLDTLVIKLKDKSYIIIPCVIFTMGFLGALGSMITTGILFVPITLALAKKLKGDRAFGVALVILGSFTGFMSSPVNTLTTVLAQDIAGIPPFSGSGLRTVVTIVNLALVSAYMVWYARRVAADADTQRAAWEEDEQPGDAMAAIAAAKLSGRDIFVLLLFFGGFVFFAIGAPVFKFTISTLGSVMLPIGLACGFAAGYDLDTTMRHFVQGAKDMCGVMVFMILTCLMSVILNKSMILDTLVHYLSIPLDMMGGTLAAIGMFIANAIINIFINSGSGQTAVMMPIMAPLADVIGVSRQMAVLTLQYGDGFTNLLAPTSVNLMACLALAKVSLREWYRFAIPIHVIMFVFMCGSIVFGMATGY